MEKSVPDQRDDRKPVSLRRSDFRKISADDDEYHLMGAPEHPDEEERRPTLADVKGFTVKKAPPEKRDEDRLNWTLPKLVHDAAEMLADRAHVPVNTAALWALDRGLRRLGGIPDVRKILRIRQALAEAALDDGQHEWTYRAGSGTKERFDIRHVGKNKARYMELKRGLGLQATSMGTILLMAGLVDAPIAAGLAEPMRLELLEWQRKLQRQLRIVRSIQSDTANQSPSSSENRLSWSQIRLK